MKGFQEIQLKMPNSKRLKTKNPLTSHFLTAKSTTNIKHSLFVKKDSNRDYPLNTIFIVNLPTDSTEKVLHTMFKPFGEIENLDIIGQESGLYCHLTFKDEESIDLVMGLKKLTWPAFESIMDSKYC